MSIRQLQRFRDQIIEVRALEEERALAIESFPHMNEAGRERFQRDLRRRLGGDTFGGYRQIPKDQTQAYLKARVPRTTA